MSEEMFRLSIFLVVLVAVASLEWLFPKRPWRESRTKRWGINLGIIGINVVVQRLTLGAAAVLIALHVQAEGWGLLNLVDWPIWLKLLAGFLILDLAIYLQHIMSHALPFFWRLHKVHHADLDLDVTSGLRFHPLEIIISVIYKVAVVAAFGIDPVAVLLFEAVLNASAMFTHGNIRIPGKLDTFLRYLICTPDMHRVHHSIHPREANSNFGFFLSIWDRFLGTMQHAPKDGHLGVTLGLRELQKTEDVTLGKLLLLPFSNQSQGYSFGPEIRKVNEQGADTQSTGEKV